MPSTEIKIIRLPPAETKTFRLMISPQTHVRTTKDERWLMSEKVTDAYLIAFGKKKVDQRVADKKNYVGTPNDYLNRKNTIKKYFDYKRKLKIEADKQKFVIPEENVWFRFYIPMPKSWSKRKRNAMCFQQHKTRPDIDNLSKGVFDSLLIEDKALSDYRASKFWIDMPTGYIEIEVGALPAAIGYKKFTREDTLK